MRSLEEVLKDLKEAEKEYQEKCLKYGIEEKQKRKLKADDDPKNSNDETNKDQH
ncbi:MAG: hypothetical protein IJJ00_07055 [Erysipelotrichaceae bacterium]|nr:hypothetical protein [Erysipelotrichaceae bacterium]